jgi:hypothetical protein
MTVEQLNAFATSLCKEHDINILYSRVDENNHTGKLVVDRLEDYNILKSNTGDVSFYRFSPLNVPTNQSRGPQRTNNNENSEWTTVQTPARRQTVQGSYTQGAPNQNVTRGGPRAQRGGGRGGASRGRGGRSAPASS